MRDFCINGNIIRHLTAVGLPRGNGQVERYHKTLLTSLATMGANTNDDQWDENMINIQLGLNGTVNATIGVTPSEALMGFRVKKKPVLDNGLPDVVDVTRVREKISQRIAKHQAEQKRHFDSRRREAPTYDTGDLVMTTVIANPPSGHSQKLLPKWRGPPGDSVAGQNATIRFGRSRRPRGPTYARGTNRSLFENQEQAR
jgi:hypothetical protein